MRNYIKLILFLTIFFLINSLYDTENKFIYALTINFKNIEDFHLMDQKIMDNINLIDPTENIEKETAQQIKFKIANEFEEKFEVYKDRIRTLNEEYITLEEVINNIDEIKSLKKQIEILKQNKQKSISSLIKSNNDVYIPVLYASFIEIPLKYERFKNKLIDLEIVPEIIEEYGITKIINQSNTNLFTLKDDTIISEQNGSVEIDGVRSFDGKDLVLRINNMSMFLFNHMYRFKPFTERRKGVKQNLVENKLQNYSTKHWNLANPKEKSELIIFIKKNFGHESERYLNELDGYLRSFGDITSKIQSAEKRVNNVLEKIQRINLKYTTEIKNKIYLKNEKERTNYNLLSKLNLKNTEDIDLLINIQKSKLNERKMIEKSFEYKFVHMEQRYSKDFINGVKNTLSEILIEISDLIKKQTINIQTIVNNGTLIEYNKASSVFIPIFKNSYIQTYTDRSEIGVLFTLTVNYEKRSADSRKFSDVTHTKPDPYSITTYDETYNENCCGINIKMKKIATGDSFFYISENEIRKATVDIFLSHNNLNYHDIIKDRDCIEIIKDYPKEYAMLCMEKRSINQFIKWINQNSVKKYRLMTSKDEIKTMKYGIFKGEGFRIISDK